MEFLHTYGWAGVLGLAGVFFHVVKQASMDGQGWKALTGYVEGHVLSIILVVGGLAGSLLLLDNDGTLTLYTAFISGYMADSFLGSVKIKDPKA